MSKRSERINVPTHMPELSVGDVQAGANRSGSGA